MAPYPESSPARDRFIVDRRPPRAAVDPWSRPPVLVEDERGPDGSIGPVMTIFLAGAECAWRCAMCDLWRGTVPDATPPGAIPSQIRAAWPARPPACRTVKLYNAGSFFDGRAVPFEDYAAIVDAVAGAAHVIVESHPALIGVRTRALRDRLSAAPRPATLEVAIGLETAHPGALSQLNKRMTVADVAEAAGMLRRDGIGLRVFLLVGPPFIAPVDQDAWLGRSVDTALACGATAITLIPTRGGNGTLEVLADEGRFAPPTLADLERGLADALTRARGSGARMFADLWDLERVSRCDACLDARRARLAAMNHAQEILPAPACTRCGAAS